MPDHITITISLKDARTIVQATPFLSDKARQEIIAKMFTPNPGDWYAAERYRPEW